MNKQKQKRTTFIADFKKFINNRGNIVDLAIAVVIAAAFGKIISSLVDSVIMPLLSLVLGKNSFADLVWDINIGSAHAAIGYGAFIQSAVDFLVIAICIFILIRLIMKAQDGFKKLYNRKKAQAECAAPAIPLASVEPPTPPKPTQEELLTEIRDLLKEKIIKSGE